MKCIGIRSRNSNTYINFEIECAKFKDMCKFKESLRMHSRYTPTNILINKVPWYKRRRRGLSKLGYEDDVTFKTELEFKNYIIHRIKKSNNNLEFNFFKFIRENAESPYKQQRDGLEVG